MSREHTEEAPESYSCPDCMAGIVSLQHITYFTHLNDELVSVPEFPAWVCDICGRHEYDPRAISWLNVLLDPHAGHTSRAPRRSHPPTEEPPAPTISE